MRPRVLLGIALIVIGGLLFAQGGTFTTREQVLEIGDLKVTAPEEHTVPTWTGGAAMLAGLGLVVVGLQRRGQS